MAQSGTDLKMAKLLPFKLYVSISSEISNFQQRFDESFHEAWDRYKDLLCACPHHGFTELHQLDTFYNALNPANQDSLNSAAGCNLLERRTQDVLMIIENKSKFQATPPPTSVKSVEEICVTCGGAHPYYQCLAAGGNTFPELRDNIQGYVTAVAVNYNQGNSVYRPPGMAIKFDHWVLLNRMCKITKNRFSQLQGYNRGNNFNPKQSYQAPTQQNQVVPLSELEKFKRINEANMKAMQTQINNVKNELINEMKILIQASMSNQTNELKNMMASFFQMNTASTSGSGSLPRNTIANPKDELKAIITRSGIVLDGPSVPIPPLFINLEEDERVKKTLTDQDLAEYTIKLHINITLADALILISKYQKMLKSLLSNKEKLLELANTLLNENYSAVILKKLPEKLRDPGKFLISCSFIELKCKALANLGAIINLIPLFVWKNLADFVIIDYESDPRVPLIMGRPFLRTACALIGVHGEEMILRDGDERLTLSTRRDTSSYSNQPQKESINMIDIYDDSSEGFLKKLFTTNHQSGNPTFSSNLKLTLPKVKDGVFDPDQVLKHLFPSPIPTFLIHTEETNSGSTTTHVDYSLPKYDSFLFEIEPNQGKLTSVVMKDNLVEPRVHVPNVLTTHPTLMLDSDFIPSGNFLPEFKTFYFDIKEKNSGTTTIHADISLPDLECFNFYFNLDQSELTSILDFWICENILFVTNANFPPEEDHSPLFTYVVWIFISFLTHLVVPPHLFSFKNEDTIFDPGIANYHFPSLLPDETRRCETFMKFNVYPKLLNESSMEILSSSFSPIEQ
uniref:Retrotransposon gag domain-containing protein n=1 Tax=Tanacetum cinerariifolium TaxID=118510 RepID=A0A699INJ4_TANCI|nr:hypothetical protein [Tanacetum cinerariifolium]